MITLASDNSRYTYLARFRPSKMERPSLNLVSQTPRPKGVVVDPLFAKDFGPCFWGGGGAKRMGGGKRTRERALPTNSGSFQNSFWSAQSWISVHRGKTEQRHSKGVENVPYEGGPKNPFLGGVSSVRFSSPPLFSTPPWHPLPRLAYPLSLCEELFCLAFI